MKYVSMRLKKPYPKVSVKYYRLDGSVGVQCSFIAFSSVKKPDFKESFEEAKELFKNDPDLKFIDRDIN